MAVDRELLAGEMDAAERDATELVDRHDAGQIDTTALAGLLAAAILRHEVRAVALADVALAAEVSRQTGRAVHPLGLGLADADADATVKAARTATMTETAMPARARAVRLARGRTGGTAGKYYDLGLARHRDVAGYTRGLSATACELCRWLYRDGHVWPADTPMHRHPGCTCVPIPTVRR